MKKIITLIFILASLFFVPSAYAQGTNYKSNPTLCPTEDDNIQEGVSCSGGEKICGATATQIYCYDNSLLSPASSSTTETTSYNSSFNSSGGHVVDCYDNDGVVPRCDNSGNYLCNRKTECYNLNRVTQCASGVFNSAGGSAASCQSGTVGTATGCISGKYNCYNEDAQGNSGSCEASNGSDYRSSAATNATYGANCGATSCDSGYIDCDDSSNDPDDGDATGQSDADGCEETLTNTGYNNSQFTTGSTGYGAGNYCGVECQSGYLSCTIAANNSTVVASDYDLVGCNIDKSTTVVDPSAFSKASYNSIPDATWDGNVLHGNSCGAFVCNGSTLDCNEATLGANRIGTDGNIDSGKGDDGTCEQTDGGDASGNHYANTEYDTSSGSCQVECSANSYNKNGTLGDGCEITNGDSCEPGGGQSGTYVCTGGVGGSCTCTAVDPLNFQTGIQASFTTANALLWGTADGTGPLISFTNSNDANAIFYVTNDGDVGIGTATPVANLQTSSADTSTTSVILASDSTGDGHGLGLWSGYSGGTPNQPAILWSDGEDLRFGGGITDFSAGATFEQRMVIKDDGNVGIGYASPYSKLDIDTDSNTTGLRLRGLSETVQIADFYVSDTGALILDNTVGSDNQAFLDLRPEDDQFGLILRESDGTGAVIFANFYVTDTTDDYLSINVNSATNGDALVVTASDNVGIGTTGPAKKLEVAVGSSSNDGIFIEGSNGPGLIIGSTITTNNAMHFVWQSSGLSIHSWGRTFGDQLFIDGDAANVGIGTTSPDRKLDILDASYPQLRLTQTDGTVYADLQVDSNGDLLMNVDGQSNQLVLDNGGNVGIGDASPVALFTVGDTDLFQVNSSGAIAATTGLTSSGTITLSSLTTNGVVTVSSGVLGSKAEGSGSGLDADTLDNLDSLQFLRSDISDAFTGTTLTFNDSTTLALGTEDDFTISHDGTNTLFDNTFVTGATQFQLGTDTNATAFQVLNDTGDNLFEVDGSGNMSIGSSTITPSSAKLEFASSVSGSAYYPVFRTADSDRTDDLKMILSGWYQDDSNLEFLFFGWDQAEQQYEIRSNALGSGSVQNLSIFTLGNDDQLFLNTSGNVGVGDDTPAAKLTVGAGDLFQVNSSGAIAAATGIISSGTITFSGLSDGLVKSASGVLSGANSVTLTSEVSGILPIANGGTNKALALSAGGIPYFDADSFEVLGAGSSGQFLTSGGADAPTWTTAGSGGGLDADTLDSIDSLSFLRSDTSDAFTSGTLTFNDFTVLALGTDDDFTISHGGTNTVFDNTFVTGATQFQLGTDTNATAFQVLNNTGTNLFEVDGAGNVGIGDTTPDYKLDVAGGNIAVDPDYSIFNTYNNVKVLDTIESLSGWSATGTEVLSTNSKMGSYSIQVTYPASTSSTYSITSTNDFGDLTDFSNDDDYLEFWLYVSDASEMGTTLVAELGNTMDTAEYQWVKGQGFPTLVDGWNKVVLRMGNASQGSVNWSTGVDWFRLIYNGTGTNLEFDLAIDDLRMTSNRKESVPRDLALNDALTVFGNVGIGDGNFLQTPGNPTIAGSYTSTPNINGPQRVDVVGKYAYVAASGGSELTILDISDPDSPTLEGNLNDGTNLNAATGIKVSGNYAYITTQNNNSLTIVDVSNPNAPVFVGSVTSLGTPIGVYISGRYAYVVSSGQDRLYVIDISDPTNPTTVGTLTDGTNMDFPYDVFVQGSYAYVAAYNSDSLAVIDISDPTTPTLTGSLLDGTNMDSATSVYVGGKYAYVTGYLSDSLAVIDVSNPALPTHINSLFSLNGASEVKVAGNYAYVVSAVADSLSIVDISDPANLSLAGAVSSGSLMEDVSGVDISGKYAYVTGFTSDTFAVIDIAGIHAPAANIGSLSSSAIGITENLTVGNNAYIQNGLNVGPGGLYVDAGEVSFDGNSGATAFRFGQRGTGDILNVFDDSTEVFTILDGGNVGIGTATPDMALTVSGDANITNGNGLVIGNSSQVTTFGTAPELQVLGTGDVDSSMLIASWQANSNGPGLSFGKSRNATIGSSTIVQDGDILGGLFFYPDEGSGVGFSTQNASFTAIVDDASPEAYQIGAAFVWQQSPQDGSITETMRLTAAGNLGIGTTGPDRKLDVLDASNPQLRLTQADGTVYADLQVDSNGDLLMNVDGQTNQLVLDNGGNVGIGTTNPTQALDVAGSVKTSDSYVFSDGSTQAVASTPDGFGWQVSSASFNQNFSVSAEETMPASVFFKPDGTKMYIIGNDDDNVDEYNLSTPWDISTASFNQLFNVNSQESNPRGVFFKPDGTKMYITGYNGDEVNEYNLSTPWSVTTASFNQLFDVSSEETEPQGLFFKPDGTKMYLTGKINDNVNEYDLSTPWDIYTASFNQLFDVLPQENNAQDVFFKPDGTKMYITGYSGDDVNEYDLSTPWDVATASFKRVFSVVTEGTDPTGIFFKPDGTKMYVVGYSYTEYIPEVNEYDLGLIIEGNVGIGTTSPASILHVHTASATDNLIQITNSTSGSTSSDGLFVGVDADGSGRIEMKDDETLSIYGPSAFESVRVGRGSTNGQIMLGNIGGSEAIIAGDLYGGGYAGIQHMLTDDTMIAQNANGRVIISYDSGQELQIQTDNSVDIATFDGNGNVGIGDTTPIEALTITNDGDILVQGGNLITPYGGFGQYENLLKYSEQFDNAAWTDPLSKTTVTANNATAPDNTSTADTLKWTGSGTGLRHSVTLTDSATYTFSIWARLSNDVGGGVISVDFGDGTSGSLTATSVWQRFSVTLAAGTSDFVDFMHSGYSGFEIWGAQLENGSTANVYARTEATAIDTTGYGFVAQSDGPHLFLNGNVGIGVTDPSTALGVSGSISADGNITSGGKLLATGTGDGTILLQFETDRRWVFQQEGSGSGTALRLRNLLGINKNFYIDTDGYTKWRSVDGITTRMSINQGNGNLWVGGSVTADTLGIVGDVNLDSNTLFVDSSENRVGIGTTTPSTKLHVKGLGSTDAVLLLEPGEWDSAGDYGELRFGDTNHYIRGEYTNGMTLYDSNGFTFSGSTSVQVSGWGSGTVVSDGSGNLSISSDEKLKNIAGSFDKGLEAIRGLEPINYQWNEISGMETDGTYSGFSSQNVQGFIPEAVGEGSDGYLTLSDRPILAATVNAVKELDDKFEGQILVLGEVNDGLVVETGSNITALKFKLDGLIDRVEALETSQSTVLSAESTEATESAEIIQEVNFAEQMSEEELVEYVDLAPVEALNYQIWKVIEMVVFNAKVRFEDIVEFASNVIFKGSITVNTDTAGTIIIPAGSTKVKATFNTPFEKVPVVSLTPVKSSLTSYWLEEVTEEGFLISIPLPEDKDITFSWTALIVEGDPIQVDTVPDVFEELGLEDVEVATDSAELEKLEVIILESELGYVRVREEATTESPQIGEVLPGETYNYKEISEEWYFVEYVQGSWGWVSGTYVEEII